MVVFIFSCQTGPEPLPTNVENRPTETGTTASPDIFDPTRVSTELYNSTREEVQQFINSLNQMIRTRNFNAWRDTLSPEYHELLSSPAFLAQVSAEPLMRAQNRTLRNLNDYFLHVFVPSRNPDRIRTDDIDIVFITQSKVTAHTVTTGGARQTLYTLEKINNSWKIINPESIN
jgi:hypothetical protein